MLKRFNVTGVCIPEQHYMADISGKKRLACRSFISGENVSGKL